ncbi:hypothetical protein RJT34_07559 [Clitoria ternatea]|uniref:Uncharacterized protein n=1 Tax=Clitoria ternatea TaxID=43366 RepID=A0AAN9PU99_CLITE
MCNKTRKEGRSQERTKVVYWVEEKRCKDKENAIQVLSVEETSWLMNLGTGLCDRVVEFCLKDKEKKQ